ncbi:SPASM domain-containing protein [Candidatus Microgenomates bacterium]|nr:SPASM domain-containing protein [Candidatus Microgenomates bacterium]
MSITKRYDGKTEAAQQKVEALIFETTNRCSTCACPGCYMIESGRNHGPLQQFNLETAVRVFDLVKIHNGGVEVESLDIIGGEPLEPVCWPVTQMIVEECLQRGIKPWVFSNGVFITNKKAKWLLAREIPVTMKLNIGNPNDSTQLELQAKMIGKDVTTAKRLIRGLYTALEVGYAKSGLLFVENLLREGPELNNMPYVPQYYELGLDLGFKPDLELMGNGESANWKYFELAPKIPTIRWLMRQIEEAHAKRRLAKPEFLMPHVLGSCPFYDTALYFCADGRIQSCSNNQTILANFNTDSDPIGKAIAHPIIQARRTLKQKQMQGPCARCPIWDKCRGGCRATAESFGSSYLSYPLCPIQQEFDNPRAIIAAQ